MIRVFAAAIGEVPDPVLRADLEPLLTPQRRERIGRLVRAEDVARTLLGEQLIRRIVACELGLQGTDVCLETNAYGKPFLVGHPDFQFNLSHSGRWVVCAAGGVPVGIDIERETDADWKEPASFFSAVEQRDLSDVPAADRRSHFYRLWTLKESFLKCRGEGFFIDPASFTIKIEGGGIHLLPPSGEIDRTYCFRTFHFDRGYAMAGCSEGEPFARDVTRV